MLPSSLPLEKKRVVGHVSGEGLAPIVKAYSRLVTDPRRWSGTVSYYSIIHVVVLNLQFSHDTNYTDRT
jgi:hypothetical protein